MRAALRLARKGVGFTSPNPAVGAVIVRNNKILARGYHKGAGRAHGEIEAFNALKGGSAKGATLYVTLEPCCVFGRTPPCTKAVIGAGVKKAVVGSMDPNPAVAGRGVRELQSAGIQVRTGVLEKECLAINEGYVKFITTGLPLVTLKLAASLDGRIATAAGESKWITGEGARGYVHRLRAAVDAVMVGAGTVLKDDPALTARPVKGGSKNPARVVVDSAFRTPLKAKVFRDIEGSGLYIFTTGRAKSAKINKARALGARVFVMREAAGGIALGGVLKRLGREEITSIIIEGGAGLAASAIKEGIVDKVLWFTSPKILGGDATPAVAGLGIRSLKKAPVIKGARVRRMGDDILIEGYF